MKSSAGVPRVALGSASRFGGTWPCGPTIGRSSTYSQRLLVRERLAGFGSNSLSGSSVQDLLIGFLRSQRARGGAGNASLDQQRSDRDARAGAPGVDRGSVPP